MKFCSIISLALALARPTDATNYDICAKKSPNVVAAIWDFCKKTDMVVPSDYAMHYQKGNVILGIGGPCQPTQWVPQEWCRKQLLEMCANGNEKTKIKRFGRNDCQTWMIDVE